MKKGKNLFTLIVAQQLGQIAAHHTREEIAEIMGDILADLCETMGRHMVNVTGGKDGADLLLLPKVTKLVKAAYDDHKEVVAAIRAARAINKAMEEQ
jgi:hypothetical protein